MTRRMLAALAAVLAVATLAPPAASGRPDPERAERWRAVAERAYDRMQELDDGPQPASVLAYAAQATAWLEPGGWNEPAAADYLTRLYATANPDGGYGLGYPYDAHQDGTINPATTTYIVTLSGYVGPTLLDAYRAGVAPRSRVQKIYDLIATAPRIDTADGRCIAYSRSSNDAKSGLCVHNVSSSAAAFLLEGGKDGFSVPWWLVQGIVKREMSAYNANGRFWPYKDATDPAPQDADHNSYSVETMYDLAYPVAYSAAYYALTTEPDGQPATPIVGMRLAGLPRAPTAMSGADTVWCVLGDAWLDDAQAFVTSGWNNIGRLSQAAYYASRAARACA